MQTDASTPRAEYINNPFMIAVRGLNALFLNAQGVAIFLIILSLLSYLPNLVQSHTGTQAASRLPSYEQILAVLPILIGVTIVAAVVGLIISTIIGGISGYAAARVARGEATTFSEAAKATFTSFPALLWLQFLLSIKLLGWTLLLIVPGVIMSIRYTFATTIFFDKKLHGNAAIKESINLTRGSWITTFGALTIFNAITLSIISPLVQTATTALLYRQYIATSNDERPKPHGLSIAAMVLTILAIFIGIGAAVLVVAYGTTTPTGTTLSV